MAGYIRTEPLKGAIAVVVEPGFIVRLADGDHTISDDLIVNKHRVIYCTEANVERVKAFRYVGGVPIPINAPLRPLRYPAPSGIAC